MEFLLVSLPFFMAGFCLSIGGKEALKGKNFWATKLLSVSATLVIISAVLMLFAAFLLAVGGGLVSTPFLVLGLVTLVLGLPLFAIAFIGFCARWGATGKRIEELEVLAAALRTASSQSPQTNTPQNNAHS